MKAWRATPLLTASETRDHGWPGPSRCIHSAVRGTRPAMRLVTASNAPIGTSPSPWLGSIRVWLAPDHGNAARASDTHASGTTARNAAINAAATDAHVSAGHARLRR